MTATSARDEWLRLQVTLCVAAEATVTLFAPRLLDVHLNADEAPALGAAFAAANISTAFKVPAPAMALTLARSAPSLMTCPVTDLLPITA
jgi:molecular chaperone DnaK (HSP70)